MKRECRIGSRDELVEALRTAAELEHGLCCQYLFTAFTMRKTDVDFKSVPDRIALQLAQRWAGALFLIARQEMEHLGLVCNLLNAVGADPHFKRPNFPQPAKRYPLQIPFWLAPFDVPALRRFVWAEKPKDLVPSFPSHGYCSTHPAPSTANRLEELDVPETKYVSVQELYEEIRAAFQTLNPSDIFIGNPDGQVDGSQFFYRVTIEPVANRAQAAAAINLIIAQGEGVGLTPLAPNASHFQMLVQILREFEDAKRASPSFDPTLSVVENPVLKQNPGAGPGTIVSHVPSRLGMKLFNEAYHLLVTMLRSWFKSYSLSQNCPQQAAEFYAAFFPLMTMVIRPLGEILTRMPAGVDGKNAGPSFELPSGVDDQPVDRDWFLCKFQELETKCVALGSEVPSLKVRLTFMSQNIHATRLHFANLWTAGQRPTLVSHFPV